MIIDSRAYARAGLLGNPSDGYYGKTISVSVRNFSAHVSLYQTPELRIEPQKQDINVFKNMYDFCESVRLHGYYGGDRLIKAAIRRFFAYCTSSNLQLEKKNFTIRYQSSIPRQVGLAGSSAIVTATMKGLMQFYNISIPEEFLPTLVLQAETEELGINAGLQDRVIQVYEGCVYMDFKKEYLDATGCGKYERLDPQHLPKLFIAYRLDLGKVSGAMFNDIRSRYNAGDSLVIDTLSQIAELAARGKKALEQGDGDALFPLMNENFDLRRKIMNISSDNIALVEAARSCGASAKFAGSGGSVIGIYRDEEMLNRLINAMRKLKARVIKPYVV